MRNGELSTTKVAAHTHCEKWNAFFSRVCVSEHVRLKVSNCVPTVERRRRDKINNWIVQLSKAIPDCNIDYTKTGQVSPAHTVTPAKVTPPAKVSALYSHQDKNTEELSVHLCFRVKEESCPKPASTSRSSDRVT